MRIDLFEFVEGLIRGIVYFLYNLIETIWQIFRHPFRGPLRLYRAHVRKDQKQVGSLTLLFVFFFVFIGLSGSTGITSRGNRGEAAAVLQILSAPPKFDSQEAWLLIVGALVATVMVDAVLRAFLLWRLDRRKGRREVLIAATEYALMLPLLIVLVWAAFYDTFWRYQNVNSQFGKMVDPSLVTLVFVAFIPPAWFLTAIRRPPTKRHWVRRIPRLLGSYMALFALVFLATIAGDAAVARLITLKSDSEHMRLVIEGRFCNLAADRPSADFAVNNPTNRPIFVTPYETTEVGVLIPDADFPADEFGEFEFYSPREATNKVTPVLIRPNDTEIVRFDVPQELAARAAKPYSCLVHRRPGANDDEIKWQDEEFKEFM